MNNNNKEEKNNKKKNWRIYLIIFISISVVIDIILMIIFIPKLINKNKSNNEPYVVEEYTIKRYENLLSYISLERKSASMDAVKEIIALTYQESTLNIAFKSETQPGYMRISFSSNYSLNEALDAFKDKVPTLGTYTTSMMNGTYVNNISLNLPYSSYKGMIYTYGDKNYVACTYQYDKDIYASLLEEEYKENGDYQNVMTVNKKDNKVLYDLYYLIVNN